jgi:hypothetical protein
MNTPARMLIPRLYGRLDYPIQGIDGKLSTCTLAQARALARAGMIEGIGPRSGEIKMLKMRDDPSVVNTDALSAAISIEDQSTEGSLSHIAIGAYKQALSCVTVDENHGVRSVLAEGEVVAHVYAFEMLRGRKESLAGL